jgi:hypothetical protein
VLKKAFPGSHGLMTYDGFGRLTKIHHKDTSSGNTLAQFDYGYDDAHQVTHQDKLFYDDVANTRITTDTVDKGDQYAYDGAKRLLTVLRGVPTSKITTAIATNITNGDYDDKVEYHYDQTGNRLTREIDDSNDVTYDHNAVNEMTTEGASTLDYYDNGTYKGIGSVEHKYNVDDQYAWWKKNASLSYTWHYDALGRQVARTRSGETGATDVRFYYDGIHDIEIVGWVSSTETLKRKMVYGEMVNELLEHTHTTPDPDNVYYAHADKLGSIMVMVDNTGAIQESYQADDAGQQHRELEALHRARVGAAGELRGRLVLRAGTGLPARGGEVCAERPAAVWRLFQHVPVCEQPAA